MLEDDQFKGLWIRGVIMKESCISVDGINFPTEWGVPFSFDGVFSRQKLLGIELSFTVYGSHKQEQVENLLKKDKVIVEDPFGGQTYEASTWMKSSSFQVGKQEKSYVIELKQIETLPSFDMIEIEGITFRVLRYEESIAETPDKIGRHSLLKLTKEEFEQFHKLLESSSVKFRRIGIDDVPLELRFGSRMYWSQHTDDGKEHFKQIVRLFPVDLEPSKLNLASGITQGIIARMLISVHARFELLVQELATNKVISAEIQTALLSSGWRDLLPNEKIDQLWDSLDQVEDAEQQF